MATKVSQNISHSLSLFIYVKTMPMTRIKIGLFQIGRAKIEIAMSFTARSCASGVMVRYQPIESIPQLPKESHEKY